ncbi:MAG TPA: Dabb family protein [Candidatus Saccharimonadales bacterium]|nr:Dabb family protein [Candidatus Saccharimonadales bacterium]
MIRHVVLWAFKDSVPLAERDAILAAVRALATTVPSLRSLDVGENVSPARAQGYTHVLLETFDDRAGLAAYASHPDHLPVLARLRDAVAELLAVDLEV